MTATPPPGQPATPAEALVCHCSPPAHARGISRCAENSAAELDVAPAAPCGCRTADEHAKVTAALSSEPVAQPAGDWLGEELNRADQALGDLPTWAQPVVTRPAAARATDPGPAAPTTPASEVPPVDRSGYEVTVEVAENVDRADSGRRVDAKVLAATQVALAYELAALACDYHLVAAKQAIADREEYGPLSTVPPARTRCRNCEGVDPQSCMMCTPPAVAALADDCLRTAAEVRARSGRRCDHCGYPAAAHPAGTEADR